MTTLHMETERVRDMTRQMDQKAQDLYSKEAALRSASNRLTWAWRGTNADYFVKRLNTQISYCNNQVQQLQELALRASHEVDEWQGVDNQSGFKNAFISLQVIVPDGGGATSNDTNDVLLDIVKKIFELTGIGVDAGSMAAMLSMIQKLAGEGLSAEEIQAAIEADPALGAISDGLGPLLSVTAGSIEYIKMFMDDMNHYTSPAKQAAAAIVDSLFVGIVTGLQVGGSELAVGLIVSGMGEIATGGGAILGVPSVLLGVVSSIDLVLGSSWVTGWFPTSSLHDSLIDAIANGLQGMTGG